MRRIKLEFESLDKDTSISFLEYFTATLRQDNQPFSLSATIDSNNQFVTTLPFVITDQNIEFRWLIYQSVEGSIIEMIIETEEPKSSNPIIETEAYKFLTRVHNLTHVKQTNKFFYRQYLRCRFFKNLSGEYWFNKFRFAPLFPEDKTAYSERIFVIDQEVNAYDRKIGESISKDRAQNYSAILSFILNVPLSEHRPETLYILPDREKPTFEVNTKFQTGFMDPFQVASMPKKNELAPIGKFKGDIEYSNIAYGGQDLVCPKNSRKIFNCFKNSPLSISERFISACRLYQVSLVAGESLPTVRLAYQIAAVETLIDMRSDTKSFTDFAVKYSNCMEKDARSLYGEIRSAHFHSGEFPLGDYESMKDFLTDPSQLIRVNYRMGAEILIRKIITGWITKEFYQYASS